jgi:hypothetical protein
MMRSWRNISLSDGLFLLYMLQMQKKAFISWFEDGINSAPNRPMWRLTQPLTWKIPIDVIFCVDGDLDFSSILLQCMNITAKNKIR